MEGVKTEKVVFMQDSGWINNRCPFCKVFPSLGGYKRIYCTNPAVIEKVYDDSMLKGCLKYMSKKHGDCANVDYKNINGSHLAGIQKKRRTPVNKQLFLEDFPVEVRLQIVIDFINGMNMKDLVKKYQCSTHIVSESKKFIFSLLQIQNEHIRIIRERKKVMVLQQLQRMRNCTNNI